MVPNHDPIYYPSLFRQIAHAAKKYNHGRLFSAKHLVQIASSGKLAEDGYLTEHYAFMGLLVDYSLDEIEQLARRCLSDDDYT